MNLKKSKVNFDISERKVLLWLVDLLAIFLSVAALNLSPYFNYIEWSTERWSWPLVLLGYYTFFALVFELYNLHRASRFDLILYPLVSALSMTVLLFLMTPLVTPVLPEHRLDLVYFFIAINACVIFWRFLYINLFGKPWFYKWVILVAKQKEVALLSQALMASDPHYKIIGYLDITQKATASNSIEGIPLVAMNELVSKLEKEGVRDIVVANSSHYKIDLGLYNHLLDLSKKGTVIRDYSQVYESMNGRVPIQQVKKEFYRFFPYHRNNQNKLALLFQRFLDLVICVVGLVVFFPLFWLVIMVLNPIFNPGPVFYTQDRIGLNGKVFRILKFRTMGVNAEKTGPQYTTKDDHRVRPFARLLRRLRVDEFPQLINIIKGDMNLIGPRPERPKFVSKLNKSIPFYEVRHVIKPGLTGWAQVNHNYGTSQDDALIKLQYDLYYIKNRSFFLDLSIMIKTLSTVLFMRGQ
tara:strand:- start:32643 stop:34043 length:1401 start_codon:yes stop_codon:yes gene_type:complete